MARARALVVSTEGQSSWHFLKDYFAIARNFHVSKESVYNDQLDRNRLLGSIKKFLEKPSEAPLKVLAFLGESSPESGAWVLQGGCVSFDEILLLWEAAQPQQGQLLVYSDASHSGHFCDLAARRQAPVFVQTSCGMHETAKSACFTHLWVRMDTQRVTRTEALTELETQSMHPQSYSPAQGQGQGQGNLNFHFNINLYGLSMLSGTPQRHSSACGSQDPWHGGGAPQMSEDASGKVETFWKEWKGGAPSSGRVPKPDTTHRRRFRGSPAQPILFLRFGRTGDEIDKAILNSPPAKELAERGVRPQRINKAKVLAEDVDIEDTNDFLNDVRGVGLDSSDDAASDAEHQQGQLSALKRSDVVVAADQKPALMDSLAMVPYKRRPGLKQCWELPTPDSVAWSTCSPLVPTSLSAHSSGEECDEVASSPREPSASSPRGPTDATRTGQADNNEALPSTSNIPDVYFGGQIHSDGLQELQHFLLLEQNDSSNAGAQDPVESGDESSTRTHDSFD